MVVLSDGFWRRELGAAADAVGSTLELGGELHEVVGVMPPGFSFPLQETELWIPLTMDPNSRAYEGSKFLSLVGRRQAVVSLEIARQEIQALAPVLQETFDLEPGFDKMAVPATVDPLKEQLNRSTRAPVLVLFAASALLLLIACFNVAQLLLATALRREQEMAIRGALGAGRGALIRQLLAESLCLATLGGGLGLLLSVWAVDLLRASLPTSTPGLESLAVDGRVFAFGLLASLATAGVFGVLPALHATRNNLRTSFDGGSRGVGETLKRQRLRWALVAGEMALAALLAVFAVSTVRSFLALSAENPGFTAAGVVSLRPEPTGVRWQDEVKVKGLLRSSPDRGGGDSEH